MLLHLSVKNLALINTLEMDFCAGFNVLTGETGAGKSIIVDSLKLALGGKNERDLIGNDAAHGIVEATFDIARNPAVHEILQQEQIEADEEQITLSRQINANGRSVCRVNGVLVSAAVVQRMAPHLVDIYGQHAHQSLLNPSSHLRFLDASDQTGEIAQDCSTLRKLYEQVNQMRNCLKQQLIDPRERERQLDMLRFQFEEIDAAALKEDEEEELTSRRERLVAAEQIAQNLNLAYERVSAGESCATDAVSAAVDALSEISRYDAAYAALQTELSDILYRLEDVGRSLRDASLDVEYDEQSLAQIEARLELIFSLKRKYGADIAQILAFAREAAERIAVLESGEQEALQLQKQIQETVLQYYDVARACSAKRHEAAERLQTRILAQLQELGMEKTQLCIRLAPIASQEECADHMTADGLDCVDFLISPNPGMPLKPLAKTVSGGELSRLMLAFKTVCTSDTDASSMVFDEIDSGIGGTTAWVIGRKMAAIARKKQVLCVTHLAPVAALADGHWNVGKTSDGTRTTTCVQALDEKGRQQEIARMLGGKQGQEAYLRHASSMLEQARQERQTL